MTAANSRSLVRGAALLLAALLLGGCVDAQQKQYNQALLALGGPGAPDAVKAIGRLANNGFAPAQFRFAILHLHGMGVPAKPELAAYWFEKAAAQGHVGGLYSLSRLYLNGVGVSKNTALALRYMTELAERGYAPAQLQLGLMYDTGVGTERDVEAAARWIRAAAEQQNPRALEAMAQAYTHGLLGVEKDPQMVEYWRDRARPKSF